MDKLLKFDNFINERYSKDKEYAVGDIVMIQYWLTGDIVPVKIIDKQSHNNYIVSHKVDTSNFSIPNIDNNVKNAPDHEVKGQFIIGKITGNDSPVEPENDITQNPRIRPDTSGLIPGWNSWNNDISI
jgi:hypothetical protein